MIKVLFFGLLFMGIISVGETTLAFGMLAGLAFLSMIGVEIFKD